MMYRPLDGSAGEAHGYCEVLTYRDVFAFQAEIDIEWREQDAVRVVSGGVTEAATRFTGGPAGGRDQLGRRRAGPKSSEASG